MPSSSLSVSELFGLRPLRPTLRQAKLVFLGDPELPKSKFGTSSLDICTPRLSIPTWRGERVHGRTVPLLNLFNRTQTPPEDGWSVRVTQVRDFRGRALTYDSHNGTDFVIPPGTEVTAAAAGRVVARRQEWNRGGLKLFLDHGEGLISSYHHLGRTLVELGQTVKPGEPIALSAYSGADGFLTFPWVAPHVHFNTFLDGKLVDPFSAAPDETSLWAHDNAPFPVGAGARLEAEPTRFDPDRVNALLDDMSDAARRRHFDARAAELADPTLLGFELVVEANAYPTRFRTPQAADLLYEDRHARQPRLHLPFLPSAYDDTAFCDDLGYR